MRRHLSLMLGGSLLGVLIYGFVNFSGFQSSWELLLSALLGIVMAYAAHYANTLLNALLPWKKHTGLRLLSGVLAHLMLWTALIVIALLSYFELSGLPFFLREDLNDPLIKIAILLFCAALIYNIIYFATYSYQHYAKGQVLELQQERRQTQLQLKALKSQLSPHFLFNSMNTLSSLFQKDTEKAEVFIRALANSYQYTLQTYGDRLVTVTEELIFVGAYCELIKTRFGNHLSLDVQLPPEVLQSKVPPLTLQMLVENAVKHNVMSAASPLKVQLAMEGKKLCVTNNKTTERPKMDSLKIGLQNIAARYELLAHKSIVILDTQEFTVQLPLIP
ncbi:histidine kinase [Flavobacteriaceae bacterium 3-367]